MFRRKIESEGLGDATLVMHTDPFDPEGPNLHEVIDLFEVRDSVVFSNERIDFNQMNVLHNVSDACINISYAEGFGLATLESMQCGNPIIAVKTGGLTRQVVDHRDGSENGIALPVEFRTCVGSQAVPYIYEDYVSNQTVADGIEKLYRMGPDGRKKLGNKAREYVMSEFNYQNVIDSWHNSLNKMLAEWKPMKNSWKKVTL
jgi:glycosyltransferase involved in cell wall biosynthesis